MQTFDFTPLYRTLVGFDRVADMIEEAAKNEPTQQGFPPYNVVQLGDDEYRIELATAGFGEDDLSIEVREGVLIVTGRKKEGDETRQFLHRGIAQRSFERRFQLADYVLVKSAVIEDGMLQIDLRRELPEAMKPRSIKIGKTHALPTRKDKQKKLLK